MYKYLQLSVNCKNKSIYKRTDEMDKQYLCVFHRKGFKCQKLSDMTRSASDASERKAALSHTMINL